MNKKYIAIGIAIILLISVVTIYLVLQNTNKEIKIYIWPNLNSNITLKVDGEIISQRQYDYNVSNGTLPPDPFFYSVETRVKNIKFTIEIIDTTTNVQEKEELYIKDGKYIIINLSQNYTTINQEKEKPLYY